MIHRLIHIESHDASKIFSELNDLKKLVKDGQLDSDPEKFHALEALLPEELKHTDMALHTEQLKRAAESFIDVASSVIDSQSVLGTSLSNMNPDSFTYSSEVMPGDSASNVGSGRKERKAGDGVKEWLTWMKIDESASGITLKGKAISEYNDALYQGLNRSHDSVEKPPSLTESSDDALYQGLNRRHDSVEKPPSLPESPDAAKPGNSSAEQDSLDRALITLSRTKVVQNQSSMIPFLQDLVSNGVNLNAQDEEGLTAMHWASREGHLVFIKFLYERGADVNLKNNKGESALHEAIQKGHTSVVKLLLKHEATDIEQKDRVARTALLLAAQQGHPTILDALLKSNADLSAKSERDDTALHLAAGQDEPDCVKLLLQNEAPIAPKNADGYTPLHMAASVSSKQCLKRLIIAGAPLEAKDSKGYTALSKATRSGQSRVVELLLQCGANTDNRGGRDDCGPLLNMAAALGHNECVKLLLDAGAPLEAVNGAGRTALVRVSLKGHSEIIMLLLKAGAKVDAQTSSGCTSLMHAALYGHRDLIEILLAAGAKIGARGRSGHTALFYVMKKHRDDGKQSFCSFCSGRETRKDVAKLLCEKGADVSAIDDHGHSLLKTLSSCKHIDRDEKKGIEKMLKRFGAK